MADSEQLQKQGGLPYQLELLRCCAADLHLERHSVLRLLACLLACLLALRGLYLALTSHRLFFGCSTDSMPGQG